MNTINTNFSGCTGKNNFKYNFIRILLLALICFTTVTYAQWSAQSPIPTNLNITGVGSFTPSSIFISTDDNSFDNIGSLFESTDGGTNWIAREIPVSLSSPFYGLFFLDDQNGWLYGNENYRTTDAGTTWTQLPFLGSTYFMKFYNPIVGITTGNFGIYMSRDGGLSWDPSPNNIFTLDFMDNQNGLGISENGIYKTTDGGNTFSLVQSGFAEAVSYLNNSAAVGIVDSMFVRSTDGGTSWTFTTQTQGRNNLVKVSADVE